MRFLSLVFCVISFLIQPAFAGYVFFSDQVARSYPVETLDHSMITYSGNGNDLAIVVGAGPAGLMDALSLHQEGFKVLVLEKRSSDFSRLNMVNLKLESESQLDQLGLLDDFKKEVASSLKLHRYFFVRNGVTEKQFDVDVSNLPKQEPTDFTSETAKSLFKNDGKFTVSIAQYQQFLAKKALERGISIYSNAQVELIGTHERSIKVILGNHEKILTPKLIVLADGASGNTEISKTLTVNEHPCNGEKWIFGNVAYQGTEAFVAVVLDYSNPGSTRIANVIFNPKLHQVNIAVTVDSEKLSVEDIKNQIKALGVQAFRLMNVDENVFVQYISDQVIHIKNKHAPLQYIGKNVVLAGDRSGVSSPLAGLGATLASTNYPYSIRILGQTFLQDHLNENQISDALNHYNETTQAYVKKWQDTARSVKNFILCHGKECQ